MPGAAFTHEEEAMFTLGAVHGACLPHTACG